MADAKQTFQPSGRQKVRLFLEGREVPVVSVTINTQIGQPTSAVAELVPLQIMKFVRARTQVHVFVRDSFTFGDDNFYLAFEGEVMGRTLIKRHDGRSLQLTMFDYSNYWDDAKAYMMNPNFLIGKAAPSVITGEPNPGSQAKADAAKPISVASTAQSQMIDYLVKYKDASGNVDLARGASGVALMLSSVNEFYRASYERLRVMDRLLVKSSGLTGKFLASLKVEDFLASYTGAHGGLSSLRELLSGIMSLILHEFVSVPFPSYVKAKRGKTTGYTIGQFMFIPDCYLLPPPQCNVIFPNQQIGFKYSDDFRAAPTRYGFRFTFPMLADGAGAAATYPIQYYPAPFADFMTGAAVTKKGVASTATDLAGGFGPSRLLVNGTNTYFSLFYGADRGKAVGTSYAPKLRESDYLSNEESIKGIYYTSDTLAPNYTALVRSGGVNIGGDGKETPAKRTDSVNRVAFMKEIGAYLFLKKRYGARQVSASIMFNPFLVPGFNTLFLDDSVAGQSFVAKLQGITHMLTNTGFSTGVSLAYARDFDESDFMSGGTGDPPLPQWFDGSTFGSTETSKKSFNLETNYLGPANPKEAGRGGGTGVISEPEVQFRNKYVSNPTVFTNLSSFYRAMIDCDAITSGVGSTAKGTPTALVTTRGATLWLIDQYIKKETQAARDAFVREYVHRPVVTMLEAFSFIGAEPKQASSNTGGNPLPDEFARFVAITDKKKTGLPGRFDGVNPDASKPYSDKLVLETRRQIIDTYAAALQKQRGFRG